MPSTRSHRNTQLVRLLALVRDLSRRDGCDIYDLAARHEVAVRTIRRDLDALAEAGVPLVDEDDGRRKRWRIAHEDPRRHISSLLDTSHYLAVRAALGGITPRNRAVASALADLASRLETSLSPADRQRLATIRDCFEGTERAAITTVAPDVLWPLMTAIVERRCCEVAYAPPTGRRSQYVVLPLRIFARDGVPYLLVHHQRRGVVMTLALHRVRKLAVTKERATPPASFDPRTYIASLFFVHGTGEEQRYRLRFSADVAPYIVERRWHPTQKLRRRRDGGVDLTFTCQESLEVSAWVASWRCNVTVLGPAVLRNEMRGLGQQLAVRYQ